MHTFGVARPLDIAFCDRDGTVLRVVRALPPNRLSPNVSGAFWAWETEAGGLDGIAAGDRLTWETSDSVAPPVVRAGRER